MGHPKILSVLNVWIFFLILSVILILKMEGKKQRFWHVILYYFKKGKIKLKFKEICALYRECAVTDQTCQISGFWRFEQVISHWTMLRIQEDLLKLIAIKSRHSLRTINIIHDILKISKSSVENHLHHLVMLIAFMFGLHASEKPFLNVFLHAFLCWNIAKTFHF